MLRAKQLVCTAALLSLAGLLGCKGSKAPEKRSAPASHQCSALKVTGVEPGQVAPGITLQNGDGKTVNTHDFCDKTVLILAGSMF